MEGAVGPVGIRGGFDRLEQRLRRSSQMGGSPQPTLRKLRLMKALRFVTTFILLFAVNRLGPEVLDSAADFVNLLGDECRLRILDGALSAAEEIIWTRAALENLLEPKMASKRSRVPKSTSS